MEVEDDPANVFLLTAPRYSSDGIAHVIKSFST